MCEDEEKKTRHALKTVVHKFSYTTEKMLDEARIYFEDIFPHLDNISKEAASIWAYAFMEIMNSAIEHSKCNRIDCIRVFQKKYPDIELIPINACRTVLGMVKHVKRD